MASTEQLKSGNFRAIYYAHGEKLRVPGTFRLESEALEAAQEAEVLARRQARAAKGTLSASITWGDWWDLVEPTRQFESDTADVERLIVKNHLRPHWGEIPLNRIDRGSVQTWATALTKKRTAKGTPYSANYVRKIYSVFSISIHAALNHAPPILTASPLGNITLPAVRRKAKQAVPLEDLPVLEEELRVDYADAVAFTMETGLRPGELIGMHEDQVDEAAQILWVTTVYVHRARKMRGRPKDEDARIIHLSARALEIYRRRIDGRDMRRPCGVEHYHGKCGRDIVFRTSLGKPMNADRLTAAMRRAADRAGLPGRSGYALRRGFATRLARGGIDLFEMMDIMGWSDPSLAREYVQQSPGARDRMMAALGDPSTQGLRVVGQEGARGMERGTTADSARLPSTESRRARRHG